MFICVLFRITPMSPRRKLLDHNRQRTVFSARRACCRPRRSRSYIRLIQQIVQLDIKFREPDIRILDLDIFVHIGVEQPIRRRSDRISIIEEVTVPVARLKPASPSQKGCRYSSLKFNTSRGTFGTCLPSRTTCVTGPPATANRSVKFTYSVSMWVSAPEKRHPSKGRQS